MGGPAVARTVLEIGEGCNENWQLRSFLSANRNQLRPGDGNILRHPCLSTHLLRLKPFSFGIAFWIANALIIWIAAAAQVNFPTPGAMLAGGAPAPYLDASLVDNTSSSRIQRTKVGSSPGVGNKFGIKFSKIKFFFDRVLISRPQ